MDRQLASQDRARWPGRALAWLSGRMADCARGVMLGALAIAEAVLMHPVLFAVAFMIPIPGIGLAARQLADLTRRLCVEWCGVPIASPYRPAPAGAGGFGSLTWRQRRQGLAGRPANLAGPGFFLLKPSL